MSSSNYDKPSNFTNLYVKNFGQEMNETKLCHLFSTYGIITSCKIQTDGNGLSKGFGFVNFERPEMAQNAMEKLNGYSLDDGKYLYVAPFQRKSERQNVLRQNQADNYNQRSSNLCLYISNLDMTIDERVLEVIFNKFGRVTKTHILRNGHQSKGIGFVCFNTIEETTRALNEMNGKWILSKPIYVKLSQDINHSQLTTPAIPPANVTYPTMIPMPYFNMPRMYYVPTVMIPSSPNNFPLPIASPNSRVRSIREYSLPPPPSPPMTAPSTNTQTK